MGGRIGILVSLPFATLVTPVVPPPGTHFVSANVSSQCSSEAHRPRQGRTSHKPVLGLHDVPLVQIA
jgi:hypothetical protein